MPAYMKMGDLKGESTDEGHKDWILIESMSSSISRSTADAAKDNERSRGTTSLHDISVVRQLDKSSVPLQVACASGKVIKEVEIHFCTEAEGKREPYLKYKLSDVIVSSYSVNPVAGGAKPMESITMSHTKAEWNYVPLNPKTLKPDGNVPGSYDLATGKAT